MNLPVQHLSDEAVAAYADGMLSSAAHNRAARHIAVCRECTAAIDEQRAAVSVLRAAPAPALPAGLLERLRAVPVTTPLTPRTMALAPDGSAVFPAYGTTIAAVSRPDRRHEYHLPVAVPHVARRGQQFALVAVAAAMITVGLAASASADTASPAPARSAPTAPGAPGGANAVQPAGFTTSRDNNELVSSVSGKRH